MTPQKSHAPRSTLSRKKWFPSVCSKKCRTHAGPENTHQRNVGWARDRLYHTCCQYYNRVYTPQARNFSRKAYKRAQHQHYIFGVLTLHTCRTNIELMCALRITSYRILSSVYQPRQKEGTALNNMLTECQARPAH